MPWVWANRRATNSSRNTTLRAACVAAVWIDASGHVGAQDVASIENEPDRTVYCCERGHQFILSYRLYEWKKAVEADQATIAAKLGEIAEHGGVGLTPHAIAVDRALEAVTAVNDTIDKMGSTGQLKAFSRRPESIQPSDISTISTPERRRGWRCWRVRRRNNRNPREPSTRCAC